MNNKTLSAPLLLLIEPPADSLEGVDVTWQYRHPLRVYCQNVRVLEHVDQVIFRHMLEGGDGRSGVLHAHQNTSCNFSH